MKLKCLNITFNFRANPLPYAVFNLCGSNLSNPDIAIAHRISVILKPYTSCFVRFVYWKSNVFRGSPNCHVVQRQCAVVHHSNVGRFNYPALLIESWRSKKDVVGLPFSRFFTGINEGDMLLVYRTCLSVRIRLIFKIIQHLNFIALLQEYPTITPALTCLLGVNF